MRAPCGHHWPLLARSRTVGCARLKTLARPWLVVLLAVGLGAWARVDALDSGFWADDFMQYAMLTHAWPSQRAVWDLFHFVDGDPADHKRMVDYGVDPWWTHPQFRLSLLRPVPSLLCAFDHRVFGFEARPHHIHSVLWWAALVASVGWLLFSVLPPEAAACAVLLFSVEESHTVPFLWLSNRSALVATVFAVAALCCHLAWRRGRSATFRFASIGLLALALSCGEYALASIGYLVCAEFAQQWPGVSRRRALLPAVTLTLGFVLLSAALGYGSSHSTLYTSPFSAPLDYAGKLATGLPVLLGDLTLSIPADWWSFGSPWPAQLHDWSELSDATWETLPAWRTWQLSGGVLGALLTAALLKWLRPRVSPADFRTLLWLLAGAVLGLFPVLSSFVTTRLVMPSSIGFCALFGTALAQGLSALVRWYSKLRARAPHSSLRADVAAVLVLGVIGYLHGVQAFSDSRHTTQFFAFVADSRTMWPLTLELDDKTSGGQRLVMFNAADANDAPHAPFIRYAYKLPLMRGFRLLSGAPGEHEVLRVDAHTLELRVLDVNGLAGSMVGSLTRAQDDWLQPGQQVDVDGMHVEVRKVHAGQPVLMRFRFDVPVDDPSLVFVESTPLGLRRLTLPAIGTRLRLAAPTMPDHNVFERARREAEGDDKAPQQ